MPLYIGLLSGTSLDGIDAALVECENNSATVHHSLSYPFPPELHASLLELTASPSSALEVIGSIDARLGECLGLAAVSLLEEAGVRPEKIRAIGSHGQTIRHRPELDFPFTWQIGDPNRIAELTGITTVADFRRRDMAAGGQGAPLAPALHQAVFRSPEEMRGVLNIGGIANLTLLPADHSVAATGFDTGPGNLLLDHWHRRHRGAPYDTDGTWAATGSIHQPLLDTLLGDSYFSLPPPKTTGREYFNAQWLEDCLSHINKVASQDVQSTLSALTARSVAGALNRWMPTCSRLLVCGGGIHNRKLMADLRAALPNVTIESTSAHGIGPDWVEAAAFAWLAHRTLAGLAGNVPDVTGARHSAILGAIYPGRPVEQQ
ncbi:MAG: anhydro-N-acetylmuramic acid kinase [Proteobacteria bacterium]|nr:MAG: anhydro-N-acetylmuramic acid kinase [Pseudomonadota bacterium]